MITISRHDGGVTIAGHAGYAPSGQDIVCAAISTLTQVFLASVEELTTDDIQYDLSAGNAVIRYGNLSERATVLLDSFFLGTQMLTDQYPQHVRLVQAWK